MIRIFTWGVFDLFHIGHLRLLQRAKAFGDWLLVGVCTDADTAIYKRTPIIPLEQRLEIIREIKCVDEVIVAPRFVGKEFYESHQINYHVQGDDVPPYYEEGFALGIMKIIGREANIDTTLIIERIVNRRTDWQL